MLNFIVTKRLDEAMDDALVDLAADMMREKLAAARMNGRSMWWNPDRCTIRGLYEHLERHVEKGDPVDIMNIAAMIAVREKMLKPQAPPGCPQPAPCPGAS